MFEIVVFNCTRISGGRLWLYSRWFYVVYFFEKTCSPGGSSMCFLLWKVVTDGGIGCKVMTFRDGYTSIIKASMRKCSLWRCEFVAVLLYEMLWIAFTL